MKVEISLLSTSQVIVIVHNNVSEAHIKDWLYCVHIADSKIVYKYPENNIFKIIETYA